MRVKVSRALQRARTSCAGFGWQRAIRERRQSYHSQTSRGSRANEFGVARSSARKLRQRPSAPRKVGTPLAAETPAPVIAVMRLARCIFDASCSSAGSIVVTIRSMGDPSIERIPVVASLAYIERVLRLPSPATATLQVESGNRYFLHAIAVIANGNKVGYVAPE